MEPGPIIISPRMGAAERWSREPAHIVPYSAAPPKEQSGEDDDIAEGCAPCSGIPVYNLPLPATLQAVQVCPGNSVVHVSSACRRAFTAAPCHHQVVAGSNR